MTRCDEFYNHWRKHPNFCDKDRNSIRNIDFYLAVVDELKDKGIEESATYVALSENAARPIFILKDLNTREVVLSNLAGKITRGVKVSAADIKAWIEAARGQPASTVIELKERKKAPSLKPAAGDFASEEKSTKPLSNQLSEAEKYPITAECIAAGCTQITRIREGLHICERNGMRPENMNGKYPEGCFRYVEEPEEEVKDPLASCTYLQPNGCGAAASFREHCDPATRTDRGCSVVDDPKEREIPLHLRNVPAQVQKGSAGILRKPAPSGGGYVPVEVGPLLLKPREVKTLQGVIDAKHAKDFETAIIWCIGCGREELERLETQGGDE